ncbi:hypothetical protein ALC57_09887 [Trachymyrmex cornetzi]|uniref:Uncharacterized protein n=1 Tax=Trachymyrmex cornetzi TaxID=471704 RepID=A0A151J4V9_9HYME|nr:hypothetical protein ALC57_09887 [Trachymyrmex cornetzi]
MNSSDFFGLHQTSLRIHLTSSEFIGLYRNSSDFIGIHEVEGNLHIDLSLRQTRGVDSPKTRGLWPPASTWRSCSKTSPFCPDRNEMGVPKTRDFNDDSSDPARRGVSTRNVSCSWNTVPQTVYELTNRKIRRTRVPLLQPASADALQCNADALLFWGETPTLRLDGGEGGRKRRDDASLSRPRHLTGITSQRSAQHDSPQSTSFTRATPSTTHLNTPKYTGEWRVELERSRADGGLSVSVDRGIVKCSLRYQLVNTEIKTIRPSVLRSINVR